MINTARANHVTSEGRSLRDELTGSDMVLRCEDDLTEYVAAFQHLMCFGGFFQRQHSADDRLDFAVKHQPHYAEEVSVCAHRGADDAQVLAKDVAGVKVDIIAAGVAD